MPLSSPWHHEPYHWPPQSYSPPLSVLPIPIPCIAVLLHHLWAPHTWPVLLRCRWPYFGQCLRQHKSLLGDAWEVKYAGDAGRVKPFLVAWLWSNTVVREMDAAWDGEDVSLCFFFALIFVSCCSFISGADLIYTFVRRLNNVWCLLQQSRMNNLSVPRDVDKGTMKFEQSFVSAYCLFVICISFFAH
jgi:hypothetical protein